MGNKSFPIHNSNKWCHFEFEAHSVRFYESSVAVLWTFSTNTGTTFKINSARKKLGYWGQKPYRTKEWFQFTIGVLTSLSIPSTPTSRPKIRLGGKIRFSTATVMLPTGKRIINHRGHKKLLIFFFVVHGIDRAPYLCQYRWYFRVR